MAAMQSSRLKTQESKVLAEMTDDGKIIETVVRAHYDTCDYTRNKMEPFLAKARASPSYAVCTGSVSPLLSAVLMNTFDNTTWRLEYSFCIFVFRWLVCSST